MAQETELKLAIDQRDIATLQQYMAQIEAEYQGVKQLENCYFDTPEKNLARNKVALRIRSVDGLYIQTLKTQGRSDVGLHQRKEWEWQISSPQLDFVLLQQAEWPEALDSPDIRAAIAEDFSTDFRREQWLVKVDGAVIELVLDQGVVSAQGLHGEASVDPLCELELELKQGSVEQLFIVAAELSEKLSLQPLDISKAERGYRLRNPEQYQPRINEVDDQSDNLVANSAFCLLERWSRYLECWQFSGRMEELQRSLSALLGLQLLNERESLLPAVVTELLECQIAELQHLLAKQELESVSACNEVLSERPLISQSARFSLQAAQCLFAKQ